MKKVRSLAVMGALVGALAAGSALAQPPADAGQGRGHRGGGFARGGGFELRGLNLTDAQRQQVQTLREQHRDQTQAAATRREIPIEEGSSDETN